MSKRFTARCVGCTFNSQGVLYECRNKNKLSITHASSIYDHCWPFTQTKLAIYQPFFGGHFRRRGTILITRSALFCYIIKSLNKKVMDHVLVYIRIYFTECLHKRSKFIYNLSWLLAVLFKTTTCCRCGLLWSTLLRWKIEPTQSRYMSRNKISKNIVVISPENIQIL